LQYGNFDTHPFHHFCDVQTARLDPFLRQQVPQHPSARKGTLHVQLIGPAPQFQVGVRERAGLAMTLLRLIPSTPAWRLTLSFDLRSIIFLRSATDPPCRARRAKNRSQRQLPDLRMQGLHVDRRFRLGRGHGPEHACGAFKKLIAPLLDLIGVNVKILSQLDQGLLALDRRYSDLSLEGRARGSGAVVSSWSSPRSRQSCRRCAENPLIPGVQFSRATPIHLCSSLKMAEPPDSGLPPSVEPAQQRAHQGVPSLKGNVATN
jgi:hypothetical protein